MNLEPPKPTTAGWVLGVGMPTLVMVVYAGMILFRADRRSLYELASGTRTVRVSVGDAPDGG